MKIRCISLVFGLLLSACSGEHSGDGERRSALPDVSLGCDSVRLPDGTFSGFALYATVDVYKVKLAQINQCEPVNRESFASQGIPADALAAVGADGVTESGLFYASALDGQIQFFRKIPPLNTSTGQFRGDLLIATYRDGKFRFEPENLKD